MLPALHAVGSPPTCGTLHYPLIVSPSQTYADARSLLHLQFHQDRQQHLKSFKTFSAIAKRNSIEVTPEEQVCFGPDQNDQSDQRFDSWRKPEPRLITKDSSSCIFFGLERILVQSVPSCIGAASEHWQASPWRMGASLRDCQNLGRLVPLAEWMQSAVGASPDLSFMLNSELSKPIGCGFRGGVKN